MNTSNNLTPYEQKQEVINLLRLERVRLNFTASLYDNGIARTEHTFQASKRRKEIDRLIEELSAPPRYIQIELFPAHGEIRAT
jgi:hypothetical protein